MEIKDLPPIKVLAKALKKAADAKDEYKQDKIRDMLDIYWYDKKKDYTKEIEREVGRLFPQPRKRS